jgi:hypothetical protein
MRMTTARAATMAKPKVSVTRMIGLSQPYLYPTQRRRNATLSIRLLMRRKNCVGNLRTSHVRSTTCVDPLLRLPTVWLRYLFHYYVTALCFRICQLSRKASQQQRACVVQRPSGSKKGRNVSHIFIKVIFHKGIVALKKISLKQYPIYLRYLMRVVANQFPKMNDVNGETTRE